MKQMNLGLAAPNLVCICVDNVKDNRIEGRIYHYYTCLLYTSKHQNSLLAAEKSLWKFWQQDSRQLFM